MQRFAMILAPLALFLTGAAAATASQASSALITAPSLAEQTPLPSRWRPIAGWPAPVWRQVHIEQRFSIRITPGTAAMPPAMVEELEEEERVERVEQHHIGKCLGINAIAAVWPGDGDELLLFLRDQRVISLTLQKRCNARDFYSGFYVARDPDGAICAGRDILQSRSGTNCKVTRLNELVPSASHRFP